MSENTKWEDLKSRKVITIIRVGKKNNSCKEIQCLYKNYFAVKKLKHSVCSLQHYSKQEKKSSIIM